jgi:type 1 glutamine amidotransferase
MMNRREMLCRGGAAAAMLGLGQFPLGWTAAAQGTKKRLLMFTKSQAFEHSVVKRHGNELSLAERTITELGAKHGFDVHCTKDGREFLPDNLAKFDAFFFETTGDLTKDGGTDGQPGMPAEGKKALLDLIAGGKGFVGSHCASDTFHSEPETRSERPKNQQRNQQDPYIQMLGGEFIVHGAQQDAVMRAVDPNFPGVKGNSAIGSGFTIKEEWYALKNFAPDLHVILVQETKGMTGNMYQRPAFPATWARMYQKGRVFYTSMGHREDVWESARFKDLITGALAWAFGNVPADVAPNLAMAAPQAMELPK